MRGLIIIACVIFLFISTAKSVPQPPPLLSPLQMYQRERQRECQRERQRECSLPFTCIKESVLMTAPLPLALSMQVWQRVCKRGSIGRAHVQQVVSERKHCALPTGGATPSK